VPSTELGAKISWLRSGYLALFAVAGYKLSLEPAIQIVRRQILECDERKMVTFTSELPHDIPLTERRIARVLAPRWHGGWVVMFGRYVVHFPAPGDVTFYDRMAGYTDGRTYVTKCRNEGWPVEPTFGLPRIIEAA